eukprot:gene8055-12517_t
MYSTFRSEHPSNKNRQKSAWIDKIPLKHQAQFQKYSVPKKKKKNTEENVVNMREKIISQIDERLKNTNLTFKILQEKYGDESTNVALFDMNGKTIWFSPSYMDTYHRKETEYLKVNLVQILTVWNADHPFTEIFMKILQEQPEHSKLDSSPILVGNGFKVGFSCELFRIDDVNSEPFGYIACSSVLGPVDSKNQH